MTTARRFGRMTAAQERVMLTASEHKNLITMEDLSAWLALSGSKIVEVGFGMGDSLHKMSQYHTAEQYLGIDVYKPGVAALLKKINDTTTGNLNVMYHDAIDVLAEIPPSTIDRIQCYFPDPWRKKRHRKRRLFHTEFTQHVARVLKDDGVWHVITDWLDYADDLVSTLRGSWVVENKKPSFYRPVTKYESRGLGKGHQIYEFVLTKSLINSCEAK